MQISGTPTDMFKKQQVCLFSLQETLLVNHVLALLVVGFKPNGNKFHFHYSFENLETFNKLLINMKKNSCFTG